MEEINEYKYCLIVSQYYHSYHTFIVKITDDFITKAKNLTTEILKYKGIEEIDIEKVNYLGDLDSKEQDKLARRYNINSCVGDIYFINSQYANYLKDVNEEYSLREYKETKRYIRKEIIEKIEKYHNYKEVKSIVEKYFEIV